MIQSVDLSVNDEGFHFQRKFHSLKSSLLDISSAAGNMDKVITFISTAARQFSHTMQI